MRDIQYETSPCGINECPNRIIKSDLHSARFCKACISYKEYLLIAGIVNFFAGSFSSVPNAIYTRYIACYIDLQISTPYNLSGVDLKILNS